MQNTEGNPYQSGSPGPSNNMVVLPWQEDLSEDPGVGDWNDLKQVPERRRISLTNGSWKRKEPFPSILGWSWEVVGWGWEAGSKRRGKIWILVHRAHEPSWVFSPPPVTSSRLSLTSVAEKEGCFIPQKSLTFSIALYDEEDKGCQQQCQ